MEGGKSVKNQCEDFTPRRKAGARMKGIAESYGYKEKDIAEILGYSDPKTVSKIYNGKYASMKKLPQIEPVPDGVKAEDLPCPIEKVRKFAEQTGTRIEYILGIDDYRTEADRKAFGNLSEEMKIYEKVLNLVGIQVKYVPSIEITGWYLKREWNYFERYMTSKTKSRLSRDDIDDNKRCWLELKWFPEIFNNHPDHASQDAFTPYYAIIKDDKPTMWSVGNIGYDDSREKDVVCANMYFSYHIVIPNQIMVNGSNLKMGCNGKKINDSEEIVFESQSDFLMTCRTIMGAMKDTAFRTVKAIRLGIGVSSGCSIES